MSLIIDGSYGEGGGQIVRSAATLAAATGRAVQIRNIRSGRTKPGLAAQHVTAVLAAARLCGAEVRGAELGSSTLDFAPRRPVRSGAFEFDVAEARQGGSAGAAMLVLQTVFLPLALAEGASTVVVRGGTHVPKSPPFESIRETWLPVLGRMGMAAEAVLDRPGWYPAGGGCVRISFAGRSRAGNLIKPIERLRRGRLLEIRGYSLTSRLPLHVGRRLAVRAQSDLLPLGLCPRITVEDREADCPGAALVLAAEYENGAASFSALGQRGKPAERVADEACDELLAFHRADAAFDRHLADQLILPAALAAAAGESLFTVDRATPHLETIAAVVRWFGIAEVNIDRSDGGAARVHVNSARSG